MFRLAIRSSATFARRRAVTGGTSSRSLSTAAAEWKDADESTAGGVLTNLQHHYKQKRAPLRGLKDVLQKCEQATELPIAVAALSLYHQKKGYGRRTTVNVTAFNTVVLFISFLLNTSQANAD